MQRNRPITGGMEGGQQRQSATGNIFTGQNFKLPDQSQLQTLQVKAELTKLGDAPRAYLDKLQSDAMAIDNGSGRLTLD